MKMFPGFIRASSRRIAWDRRQMGSGKGFVCNLPDMANKTPGFNLRPPGTLHLDGPPIRAGRLGRMVMPEEFEPKILAYCCQWCSYAAADLAGSMRLQYPPNVRIIRVPCTGRVDILYLLRAIEDGADGVFLSGCLLDDCHYVNGNYKAVKRAEKVKGMLEALGIEPERVEMYFNSSAMAPSSPRPASILPRESARWGRDIPSPKRPPPAPSAVGQR